MKYKTPIRAREYDDLVKSKMRDVVLDAGDSFTKAGQRIRASRRVFTMNCVNVRLSIWILYKFCTTYKVSADYLLGLKEQK